MVGAGSGVVELLYEFVVLPVGTGSFDCVRLRLSSLRMTVLG